MSFAIPTEYVRDCSAAAYTAIRENGLLSELRWRVYNYLYYNGPCTAKQVTKALRTANQDSGSINTRLSELKRQGVADKVGQTIDPFSNQQVSLWDVTSNMPKKLHRHAWMEVLEEHGVDDLDAYYKTKHWYRFRMNFWHRYGRTCCVTGRYAHDLVHLHYDSLFQEAFVDVKPVHKRIAGLARQLIFENRLKQHDVFNVIKTVFDETKGFRRNLKF